MPETWKMWSMDVLGYVPTLTEHTEHYVALKKIQSWVEQGLSARQIALKWNQGHAGRCSAGTNKHGVKYDSCAYAEKVLANR